MLIANRGAKADHRPVTDKTTCTGRRTAFEAVVVALMGTVIEALGFGARLGAARV